MTKDKIKQIDDLISRYKWRPALDELSGVTTNGNIELLFRKVLVLVKIQNYNEAENSIERLDELIDEDIELGIRLENSKCYFYWTKREIDSLSRSLQLIEKLLNDAQTLNISIQPIHLANYYQFRGRCNWYKGNLDDADMNYGYAQKYYRHSDSSERINGEATILMLLGLVQRHRGNIEKAISYYEKSAESFQSLNDLQSYAMVLNNLGNIFIATSRYQEAKSRFEQALTINQQLNNQREICLIVGNLGRVNYGLGDFASAIEKYTESLLIAKQLNINDLELSPLNGLGLVYKSQGQLNKAMVNYLQVLELARISGNQNVIVRILPNIASIYVLQGKFDKAKELFNEVVTIYDQYENPELLFVPNQYLSFMHKEQGELELAIDLELKNLELSTHAKQNNRIGLTLFNLISFSLMQSNLHKARIWMAELQVLSGDSNYRIKIYQRVCELLIMKDEMKEKYSQKIHEGFEQIVNDSKIEKSIIIQCSYYILEIMLIKLAEQGDTSDLLKIYQYLEGLLKIAEAEKQYHLLFTVELLKSNLYLLEFKLKEARTLMDKIINQSEMMGYYMIMNEVKDSLANIVSGESVWLKLESTNQLISKRIEALDIIEFVRTKGNSFHASPVF